MSSLHFECFVVPDTRYLQLNSDVTENGKDSSACDYFPHCIGNITSQEICDFHMH